MKENLRSNNPNFKHIKVKNKSSSDKSKGNKICLHYSNNMKYSVINVTTMGIWQEIVNYRPLQEILAQPNCRTPNKNSIGNKRRKMKVP